MGATAGQEAGRRWHAQTGSEASSGEGGGRGPTGADMEPEEEEREEDRLQNEAHDATSARFEE
eukprot:2483109-Rhodomonas_salina.1